MDKFTTFNLSEELKKQLAFKDDFSSMSTRVERAEAKNLEQELRLEYLEGRQGNVKDAMPYFDMVRFEAVLHQPSDGIDFVDYNMPFSMQEYAIEFKI